MREALGMPLRAVRLEARLAGIGRRLAGDVTSGRCDDLRAAAASIAAAEVLASRMWSSATTVPPGSQRAL